MDLLPVHIWKHVGTLSISSILIGAAPILTLVILAIFSLFFPFTKLKKKQLHIVAVKGPRSWHMTLMSNLSFSAAGIRDNTGIRIQVKTVEYVKFVKRLFHVSSDLLYVHHNLPQSRWKDRMFGCGASAPLSVLIVGHDFDTHRIYVSSVREPKRVSCSRQKDEREPMADLGAASR